MFSLPGSTRLDRRRKTASGFATREEPKDAEARRRIEELQKLEIVKGSDHSTPIPKTLSMLLEEFFAQHVDVELGPKTAERYHEQIGYLQADLVKYATRRSHSTPPQPRMEATCSERWSGSTNQSGSPALEEDSSEYRWRCLQCFQAGG
jgi:hypothetical protein